MNIIPHTINNKQIAELNADGILISSIDEALDILGTIYYQGFESLILCEQNLSPDFFDLKTKLAGETLQKFSNYRVRLVIVGDFEKYKSNSLRDFIFESNKGKQVNFVNSVQDALSNLSN